MGLGYGEKLLIGWASVVRHQKHNAVQANWEIQIKGLRGGPGPSCKHPLLWMVTTRMKPRWVPCTEMLRDFMICFRVAETRVYFKVLPLLEAALRGVLAHVLMSHLLPLCSLPGDTFLY